MYSTEGSVYTQNFDALANSPENVNLQIQTPPKIWKDDSNPDTTVSPQIISQPGWFLYHPVTQAGEGGTNQHQRFRIGAGHEQYRVVLELWRQRHDRARAGRSRIDHHRRQRRVPVDGAAADQRHRHHAQ